MTSLFYRTDLLDQAGYKAADLQDITWDQYIDIAKAVEVKTGHPILDLDLNDAGAIRIMLRSAGSWHFKADGSANIKDSAAFMPA